MNMWGRTVIENIDTSLEEHNYEEVLALNSAVSAANWTALKIVKES